MLRLTHVSLIVVSLIIAKPCFANNYRLIKGAAIISAQSSEQGISAASEYQLNKVDSFSFVSLASDKLSDIAIRVSVRGRKSSSSVRYLKSRNPCNALTIKRLLRKSRSLTCEPDWEAKIIIAPNDTFFAQLYSASAVSAGRINLPEAWNLSTGSSSIVIGVIDTGIDYNHPDLASNMWVNPGETPANGLDDDSNGYVDDVYGIDSINGDTNPYDDQSHGTHVAGTIGAVGNNSKGVVGINWSVKQIACKAFNSSGTGSVSAIVSCLNYLVSLKNNYGVNIVATNNSYGGFPYTNSMYNAINATRSAGMVYVAGAGNYSSNNDSSPFYPASFNLDNIISVGAIDSAANIASFSNFGATSVDISAPGVNILSTIPGNNYAYFNGTSMATPHVTGAIALLLSYRPAYSYLQAIDSILSNGTTVAGLAGKNATSAKLNVEAAMLYIAPIIPTPIPVTPIPEETPETNPTALPTQSPGDTQPDLKTAKISIVPFNSKTKAVVSCELSALNGNQFVPLADYVIKLSIKGIKRQRKGSSNSEGVVSFTLHPPRRKSLSVMCLSLIDIPGTGEKIVVKSKKAKVRLGLK